MAETNSVSAEPVTTLTVHVLILIDGKEVLPHALEMKMS